MFIVYTLLIAFAFFAAVVIGYRIGFNAAMQSLVGQEFFIEGIEIVRPEDMR
jgi:hypothetical protein